MHAQTSPWNGRALPPRASPPSTWAHTSDPVLRHRSYLRGNPCALNTHSTQGNSVWGAGQDTEPAPPSSRDLSQSPEGGCDSGTALCSGKGGRQSQVPGQGTRLNSSSLR